MLPARWKNPAHKKSKCGKRYDAHDAQENESAVQANLFSSCDCMSPTAGIVYRAGFVVHAAVKSDQNTDADAERECQNDPETGRSQCWFGDLHFSF